MNKYTTMKFVGSLMVGIGLTASTWVHAQSDPSGERRVTGTYAIKNATVTTAPGRSISGATILVKNGLIEAVGTNVNIPKDAQVLAGDGLFIYPGFIDGASTSGVKKPTDPERPANFDPSNPPDELAGITPWRSVLDYYETKNNQISDWRKAGITIAQILPEGGMIPGKSAIVTYGSSSSTNILAQQTGLAAKLRSSGGGRSMYPGTVLGVMAKFRDIHENAVLSSKHDRLFASNNGLNRPEINKTLQAFYPVIDKQIPVLFEVTNDLEVRRALILQKELGFKLVLVGASDIDHLAQDIKKANAQVLLSLNLPEEKNMKNGGDLSEEQKARTDRVQKAYQDALKQASALEKANIPFGFTSMGAKPNDLMKNLSIMVKNGLSEQAALAALTTNPAQILGISRFAGTLEKGKLANLVLLTAPLFHEDAQVKHVIADGYLFNYDVKAKAAANGNGTNNIQGTWDYSSDTPAGSSSGTMDIKKEGDTYTGSISYDNPSGSGKASSPMKNISLSGTTLSFSFDVVAGGMNLEVTVTGEINADQFTGSMTLRDFGSFPLNATKKPNQNN